MVPVSPCCRTPVPPSGDPSSAMAPRSAPFVQKTVSRSILTTRSYFVIDPESFFYFPPGAKAVRRGSTGRRMLCNPSATLLVWDTERSSNFRTFLKTKGQRCRGRGNAGKPPDSHRSPSVLKQKHADSLWRAWSRAAGTALPCSNNAGPGALGLPLDTGRAAEQLYFISGRDLTALGPSLPCSAEPWWAQGTAVRCHDSYAVPHCAHMVTHGCQCPQ